MSEKLYIFSYSGILLRDALINSGILLAITLGAGGIISVVSQLIYRLLGLIFGSRVAFVFANYLTIPGVIHHELSHSIAALLTGAKVRNFSIIPSGNSLGHVQIIPRGWSVLQGLQLSVSGIAPVLFGLVSTYAMLTYVYPKLSGAAPKALFWYLFVCIVLHMSLSRADWISVFKGIIGTWMLLVIVAIALGYILW